MEAWKVIFNDWIPEQQPLREALCTLGNGYFATRGAAEESDAGSVHYPGTYLACGFNRLTSEVAGRKVENEDLVNWPNWLSLKFRVEGGEWFSLDDVEIKNYRCEIDLKKGILKRTVHFTDAGGRETLLESRRLVHMKYPHLAAIEWKLTPQNWSGNVEVKSALDGTVTNSGVERYNDLEGEHLQPLETRQINNDSMLLVVQTRQSKIRMAQVACTRFFEAENQLKLASESIEEEGYIARIFNLKCREKQSLRIEKIVSLYTSRDHAISEPVLEAETAVRDAENFAALLKSHEKAWEQLWFRCDMELQEGDYTQMILRLHIFHILQTASVNTIDLDVGIPARGWHGEAYRGHIFWDELFVFPFQNFQLPELARSLLMYRYRRLPEARRAARKAGYKGAMFPWQSGSNGREESQELHLNPQSGEWDKDNTYLQRHVGAAIAYNIHQYFEATHDLEFMSFYGAELLLEIARFWSSIATWNSGRGRYEIRGVVGPDEFHTQYPGSDKPGLNNNAYTNVMAVWVLRRASRMLRELSDARKTELLDELEISDVELERWKDITHKMYIPFNSNGIISQFEGYDELEEIDWDKYRRKYDDVQRMDRILKAEGDTPNRYKVGKQADVLMLFYLFSVEQLKEIFNRLGYELEPSAIPRNVNYYLNRSSHGSTLSRLVYSWVVSRSDRESSWKAFQESLKSDFEDIQGGTTSEGIHLGAMAGTVDIIQRCYTGLEVRDGVLWINPQLPRELQSLTMRIRYRGHWIHFLFNHKIVEVTFEAGWSPKVEIGFREKVYTSGEGDRKTFSL
ncbi:MAG: glycoside hydrolase family 65 protein [Bacteroidota bacterium]